MKNCGNCRLFDKDFAPDEDPNEALGLCLWPAENLPWSLRYGNRERLAVGPLEGVGCKQFEEKA